MSDYGDHTCIGIVLSLRSSKLFSVIFTSRYFTFTAAECCCCWHSGKIPASYLQSAFSYSRCYRKRGCFSKCGQVCVLYAIEIRDDTQIFVHTLTQWKIEIHMVVLFKHVGSKPEKGANVPGAATGSSFLNLTVRKTRSKFLFFPQELVETGISSPDMPDATSLAEFKNYLCSLT